MEMIKPQRESFGPQILILEVLYVAVELEYLIILNYFPARRKFSYGSCDI